ncbi:MAG TPA: hypothetical protein VML35_00595 [Gaiellaceae bacterium]|nr:hypothetical protein [Gaiellaceae bacterium]
MSTQAAPEQQNGTLHVSFADLVEARHADVTRFHALLGSFEELFGSIVDAHWGETDGAAVALTRRERVVRSGLLRRRRKLDYRLHRSSDAIRMQTHEVADLLHDCDILAIKASHGLEQVPRAVAMQWLLLVESHLLGYLEAHTDALPEPAEIQEFARQERAELKRIEEYYIRSGEKRARMRYVEGMFSLGLLAVVVAAVATAGALELFGALDLGSAAVREFYAATAGGAVGAIASVLMRMSGRGNFVIDHELGRWEVVVAGAYRPIVGAISGIVVYFVVQTPLVPIDGDALTLPFFVVASFLAGFSERWTRMVLSGAMRTIADREPEPEKRDEKVAAPAGPVTP